ncbi:hypothetical protein Taro_039890 [Colocasia esculenta]|uniref:Uncharacterized protein n=1 Tax=Colocasia esculenta TaxID=4460 RepID=A0A843WSU0_COLES|nr:hypothetical protein [Colocasia esculenta]
MKGESPEIKENKYKKNNKLKKSKAMIATWSDEDQSEDEEENSSSSANEELCFMANSSDGKDSQRKGAKEIHKHSMAKKSLNESRKTTIQKTLALTAHSMSSEHSASSSEHKNSNGSIRTQTSVGPKTSLISKLRSLAAIHCKWIQDIGYARLEMIGEHRFTHFCLGSVDTRSGQVDTSPRFQKTQLPDWDNRSTLAQGRSTLDPVSSRPVLQKWDSRSTLDLGRSTHSGNSVT